MMFGKKKYDGDSSKGYRSKLKEVPTGQTKDNLSTKIINYNT